MNRFLSFLSVLLLLQGCAGAQQTGEPVLYSGVYQRGLVQQSADQSFQFRSCNSNRWSPLTIEDVRFNTQFERILEGAPAVSVYLEGWIDAQGRLNQMQMIGGDLATCRQTLPGAKLRAGGLEPVWYADLLDGSLEIHHSTALRSWRLNNPQVEQGPSLWRWHASESSQLNLQLRVEPRACIDILGIWYGFTARVSGEGLNLRGCARYGDLDRLLLAEKYYTRNPNLLRQVGLTLNSDAQAEVSLIDRSGARDSYQGRWLLTNDANLVVSLERQPGQPTDTLRFRLTEKGLIMASENRLLGRSLELVPGPRTLLDQLRERRQIP